MPTSSHTATGAARPLTVMGSIGWITNRRSSAAPTGALISTWPGAALVMSRAARFTASPATAYVDRKRPWYRPA